jgi:hypothetical protein
MFFSIKLLFFYAGMYFGKRDHLDQSLWWGGGLGALCFLVDPMGSTYHGIQLLYDAAVSVGICVGIMWAYFMIESIWLTLGFFVIATLAVFIGIPMVVEALPHGRLH